MSPSIPLVNLQRQHAELKSELLAAAESVMDRNAFIQGPDVSEFERGFSDLLGVSEVVGCSNGTSALALALEAVGVRAGDEVITVSHTFIATGEAIKHVGATPILVDVDAHTYTMSPKSLEAAITRRTRAVVPVHLYGTPADMDSIFEICKDRGLKVVEDAAQAHLATYKGRHVGELGDAASFSFYPGKNLGALGDAGAVATNDQVVAQKVRLLRDHGRTEKYVHEVVGYNRRMDGMQGAFLSAKLPYLTRWTARRRELASRYDAALGPSGFQIMEVDRQARSAYHLYVVQASNRNEVMDSMQKAGIGVGIHYPVPLHRQPAFSNGSTRRKELDVTDRLSERILSLPICPFIREEEVDRVCEHFLDVACP